MTPLEKKIRLFLQDRRTSDGGGWAKVTPEDVKQLGEIIQKLIELKCEKDADGDYPIEFQLVNRRETKGLQYAPLPYQSFQRREPSTREEKIAQAEKVFDRAMYNQRIAQGELSTAWELLRLEKEHL